MIRFRNISEVGSGINNFGSTTLVKTTLGLVTKKKEREVRVTASAPKYCMVAFQCCGSEMFIPDPNFFPHPGSRIQDPDPGVSKGTGSRNRTII